MVSEWRLYFHLFSKENIWSNPHSCNNNSVDRIISKEEEREDPRRDSLICLLVQNTVVFPQIIHILHEVQDFFEYSIFYTVSTCSPATPSNSTYRINSSPRNTTTTRLIPCHPVQITTRHLPATVPVSPSILHGRIRLPATLQHKQASSNSTR